MCLRHRVGGILSTPSSPSGPLPLESLLSGPFDGLFPIGTLPSRGPAMQLGALLCVPCQNRGGADLLGRPL